MKKINNKMSFILDITILLIIICLNFVIIFQNIEGNQEVIFNDIYQYQSSKNLHFLDLNRFTSEKLLSNIKYTSHNPLIISNDTALASASINDTGIETDPYFLGGWNISVTGQSGICISNTSAYFIIRDCWISTGVLDKYSGILIDHVASNTVNLTNNVIYNCYYGINIINTNSCHIMMNTGLYNRYGLVTEDSSNLQIFNNTLSFGGQGIYLERSPNSFLENNTCNNNNYSLLFSFSTISISNFGIMVYSSPNSLINNNTCNSNGYPGLYPAYALYCYGIYVYYSNETHVENNTCDFNLGMGIYIQGGETIQAIGNFCSDNSFGDIYLAFSTEVIIDSNILSQGILIEVIPYPFDTYIITNNTVNGLPIGYFINLDSSIIETQYGQVILVNCNNCTIQNLDCSDVSNGITLLYCTSCLITKNTCNFNTMNGIFISFCDNINIKNNTCRNNTDAGVFLFYSTNIVVENNSCFYMGTDDWITANGHGIFISESEDSFVKNNKCYNNTFYGIFVFNSINIDLQNNSCTQNFCGIRYSNTDNSLIEQNYLFKNFFYGILIHESSYLEIKNKTISENLKNGIEFIIDEESVSCSITWNLINNNTNYGVNLAFSAKKCVIHHNSFISNNNGGCQAQDSGQDNLWYDSESKEGNYWNDYNGIGDYFLDGYSHNKDPYPLTAPPVYHPPSTIPKTTEENGNGSWANPIVFLIILITIVGVWAGSYSLYLKRKQKKGNNKEENKIFRKRLKSKFYLPDMNFCDKIP